MSLDDKKNQEFMQRRESKSSVDRLLTEFIPENENPRSSVGIDEPHTTNDIENTSNRLEKQKQPSLKKDKRVPNYIEGYEQEE